MRNVVLLLVVGALMHAARSFVPLGSELPYALAGATLAFGFLLLSALFAGKLFAALHLPRLTGYIAVGIVAGPSLLGLLTAPMVQALGPIKGTAVCLIAFAAGGEMNLERTRPLLRVIAAVSLFGVLVTAAICGIGIFLLKAWLPFMAGMSTSEAAALSAVLGVTVSAMSPAVVMALFSELQAEGPLTRTILGVVVAADLVVIVLFAAVSSAAQTVLGGSADVAATALHLAWELFGSTVAGVLLGALLALYVKRTRASRALFVLLICVVMSEVGSRLALDPLIMALAAGLFMENVAEVETSKLVHEIEAASLPVYVVFFGLAGAMLQLDLLAAVALPAITIVVLRAAGMWFGAGRAATWAGAEPVVRRLAFAGLLPQAGLALALALLLPKTFPTFGAETATLVIGVVALNEMIMPIVMRWALSRAGEVGRAPPPRSEHPPPAPQPAAATAGGG